MPERQCVRYVCVCVCVCSRAFVDPFKSERKYVNVGGPRAW
jgi:hypothetical protein